MIPEFSDPDVPPSGATGRPSFAGETISTGRCARCRQPLLRRGRKGECLRCLVSFVSSVGQTPWTDFSPDAGPAEAPSLRYGHFEIVIGTDGRPVELGSGATATTYRARDTVLEADVALKVITRRIAEHPTARARFLREARTAAKLHHPNVAAVSYYGEQAGECYYVMELVQGETLQSRVRREGPLSPAQTLEVGVQVALALEAAEACGVVHRDLKPSNLMLVTQPAAAGATPLRVKVIDWGLAKAAAAEEPFRADHTREGFVGTPAFASPEQFANAAHRRIDTSSDIYSLGVTLWYLLCGRAPFVGDTLEEIHAQQTRQPLPLGQLTAAKVPAPLVALLRSVLAVDPRRRLQSARELRVALTRCQARLAFERRRRVGTLAGLGLLLGVGSVALVHARLVPLPGARPGLPPRAASVAILPFDNLEADGQDNFFVQGVQAEVAGKLARVAALTVVETHDPVTYPPGHRDLPAIAWELGVDQVLEGSLCRVHDKIQMRVILTDLRPPVGTPGWRGEYQGPLARVFNVESEVARAITARLGVVPTPEERMLMDAAPTNDPEAYDFYLRATAKFGFVQGNAEVLRVLHQQIALLEQAVARDPKFVLAYCALATDHDEFSLTGPDDSPEGRATDHRALAEAALQKARFLRPDDGSVHIASAYHFHTVNHDDEQARTEAELARRTLPNDPEVYQLLGMLARTAGRWDEALRAVKRAALLDPQDPRFFYDLTGIYRATRRYEEADRACVKFMALTPANTVYDHCSIRAIGPLEQRADLTPLRAALAAVDADAANRSDPANYDKLRLLLALLARDPDGISSVLAKSKQRQFDIGGFAYPAAWFTAQAAEMRGDANAVQAALASARETAAQAAQVNAGDPRCTSVLALIDAGLGRPDDAVREGRFACEMLPAARSGTLAPALACNLAVIYAWTNQRDQAFALLRDLVGQPAARNWWYRATYGDFVLNPQWDPLRQDPRFQALIERLAPVQAH